MILTGINRRIQMREISMSAAALALATPGRTALVGHWRKNDKQTVWLEWRWSLEPVSDEPEASPVSTKS